ncbi:lytic polysaccharide monooxygenase [Parathielavia hyrcaniae]|uniref:lytic cellulose monooxygenase (C4-dehydrogenating) n=1 Tax=Parathielavia hyrcaniae TaxID=113614 RepID=A0AAN6PY76_9PEZI|nr:lytic polysaccharide monooxygenase [Parathielavia hyrcaniae]
MKTTATLAALLGLVSSATAHYTFDKLLVNGEQVGGDNTYIRKHSNGYMPIKFRNAPSGSITPLDGDFACNKGATGAAQVISVKAGDRIGLRQAFGAKAIEHPGPSQVYVSPVANAKTNKGRDWYKIHQSLVCRPGPPESFRTNAWCSWGEDNVWAVIPSTIPDGQYLLRGEHIGLHGAHDGQAEFYVACAQIEVTGNTAAASIPGRSVSFPGAYQPADAPLNFSLWGRSTSYPVAPGPDVIPGGTIRGSADGAGGDKLQTVPGSGQVPASPTSAPVSTAVPSVSRPPATAIVTPVPSPTPAPPARPSKGSGCQRFPRRAASALAGRS